ncbi:MULTISPECIES: JmjC domain-containing protein [Ramlibacter]|uniref:Cupin domain-containing protein n=1 Tax=Ramlibacter pinisoli TaxID=2682844 RepID=A0A6N8IPB8_9BURK|nr:MULTISPECIES: cupin domain-containing protein [Ramlibacter]MBA2963744.1 cupin domain-containing protein [Ramlibacter sp. CGMCC 1.13660]MVQ28711.1 cupin domain-containing protein [Ramlibacter pinisoli]
MDIDTPLPLLGGLTPAQFMRRHWQRKPLLVRNAVPGMKPLLDRAALFDLAGQEGVESRLVSLGQRGWQLRRGPFTRRALPAAAQPRWTLLVQGVDLHVEAAHDLLQQFAFVPQARVDDLMASWASDGGGVGPHFDSYDVFLLQAQGRRRWRWGRQKDLALREGLPLKILDRFEPEDDQVLEPGDMLYLPPRYAHDGIAEGECQTYSIGFRAPARGALARELLERLADDAAEVAGEALYADPRQAAVADAGRIPPELRAFAADALQRALRDPLAIDRALGESLSEPKANVWFEAGPVPRRLRGIVLDRRTRMLYDERHVFVNGESWRAAGADARLMRRLADHRRLDAADVERASEAARELLLAWCEAGWAHGATA